MIIKRCTRCFAELPEPVEVPGANIREVAGSGMIGLARCDDCASRLREGRQ